MMVQAVAGMAQGCYVLNLCCLLLRYEHRFIPVMVIGLALRPWWVEQRLCVCYQC